MRYAGEVYFLPPDARDDGDEERRRHVLLRECAPADEVAIFAFASSSDLEAKFGAAHHVVVPGTDGYRGTGFRISTHVYASRIVPCSQQALTRRVGRLVDDMVFLRGALVAGLGIGTGTSLTVNAPATGSPRGHVVRLSASVTEETEITYGIVVSDPVYAQERRYLTVVPVVNAEEFAHSDDEWEVSGEAWLTSVEPSWPAANVCPRSLFSVFEPQEVERYVGAVVSDRTITEIDRALVDLFALPS